MANELLGIIKSFQKDKSQGPDGWMVKFFSDFFYIVGVDLLNIVEQVCQLGRMLGSYNSTFIVLIPKVDYPRNFSDFHPISLCNYLYKIIANIIAIRIKPLLSRVISLEQFGFLKGRLIHEAIGLVQEGFHMIKTTSRQITVLKLDLSKAYDNVSWNFLKFLLI